MFLSYFTLAWLGIKRVYQRGWFTEKLTREGFYYSVKSCQIIQQFNNEVFNLKVASSAKTEWFWEAEEISVSKEVIKIRFVFSFLIMNAPSSELQLLSWGKITSQHPRWLLSAQRLGRHANVARMQVLEQHFLGRVCLFLKCQTTFCSCYCSMICNERGTLCNPCLSASPLKIFTFRATASLPFSSQMPSECFLKEEVMQHSGKHASGWNM